MNIGFSQYFIDPNVGFLHDLSKQFLQYRVLVLLVLSVPATWTRTGILHAYLKFYLPRNEENTTCGPYAWTAGFEHTA